MVQKADSQPTPIESELSDLSTVNIKQEPELEPEVEAKDALQREVTPVSTGVSNLAAATTQLFDALDAPYTPMRAAVNRATNIAKALNLVSALQRFRICTDRLQDAGLLSPPSNQNQNEDMPVAARSLPAAAEAAKELEQLMEGAQDDSKLSSDQQPNAEPRNKISIPLEKVGGVAKDAVAVRKEIAKVRKRAAALLRYALAERNQTDVEAAVMSFHALRMLQERVANEITRLFRETQAAVHRGLEGLSTSSSLNHP